MIVSLINKLCSVVSQRVENFGAQYVAFGIFGILNYPLSFIVWSKILPQNDPGLIVRIIITLLCVPLVFANHWSIKFKKYLPLYWYVALMFAIPTFATFSLLQNHFSTGWLVNIAIGLLLFVILVDWLSFLVLIFIGAIIGIIYYFATGGVAYHVPKETIYLLLYTYLFAILIGAFFSHNRERFAAEKLQSTKLLAASIAHELRTPLASIGFSADGLKNNLQELIRGYRLAVDGKLIAPTLSRQQMGAFERMPSNLHTEANSALLVIDLLLANICQANLSLSKNEPFSMTECIEKSLQRYPFQEGLRETVHWKGGNDFQLMGDEDLMTYVLFNLLKNALYFVAKAGQGDNAEITLWLEEDKNYHYFFFKDNGTGINAFDLPLVFEAFFSRNSHHGSGIGLSFCKMVTELHGGKINCQSEQGQYTLFILKFPKSGSA